MAAPPTRPNLPPYRRNKGFLRPYLLRSGGGRWTSHDTKLKVKGHAASQRCLLSWAKHTYTPLRYKQSFHNSFVRSFVRSFIHSFVWISYIYIWSAYSPSFDQGFIHFGDRPTCLVFSNSLAFFSSVSDFNVTKFCKTCTQFSCPSHPYRMTLIVSYQLWPILARSWVVRKKDWFVPWITWWGPAGVVCWGRRVFFTGDKKKTCTSW